jgi:hypothetical protein
MPCFGASGRDNGSSRSSRIGPISLILAWQQDRIVRKVERDIVEWEIGVGDVFHAVGVQPSGFTRASVTGRQISLIRCSKRPHNQPWLTSGISGEAQFAEEERV